MALRDIDNRYREVVEDMPALVCCFLPGGEITFVNKSYCEYFGKTSEELIGSSFLSLIPKTEPKTVMENISTLKVESLTQSHEHLVIAPNGSVRWQRWNNRALFDGLGEIVSYQSIGTDITEQKQVEEALKESEEKYRNIFDNAQIGLYRSRIMDGKIVMANNRMAEIFGYESPEERVAKYVATEHYVYPELREKLVEIISQRGKVTNFEAPIRKDDGCVIWLQFSETLSSEEGFFEGVCTDITE
jgi:PAS domain S-box-containing protein